MKPRCTHYLPLTVEDLQQLRERVHTTEEVSPAPPTRLPEVRVVAPSSTKNRSVHCCDFVIPATEATEVEVDGVRWVRLRARCPCCDRVVTSAVPADTQATR